MWERRSMTARRKRIGFFIGHIGWEGHYTNILWRSAYEYCGRRGFDLLVFTGPQNLEDYVAQQLQSAVFHLVDASRVDGLIVSSCLKSFGMGQWLPGFVRQFSPIPVVGIAEAIHGLPCVVVDNASGMQAMVEHLIKVHGYRRQAFIKGRADSEDANIRYNTWLKTLMAHAIEPDMAWVLEGNFVTGFQTEKLVEAWRAGQRFDVVVAANDLMAMDMIERLHKAGIRVPDDVAVVGFDDGPQNRYGNPPLTSVHQPIAQQVSEAVDLLEAMWLGNPVPNTTTLPTTLRVRSSCGCRRAHWSVAPSLRQKILEAAADPGAFGDALAQTAAGAENPADSTFDLLTAMAALQEEGRLAAIGLGEAEIGVGLSRLYVDTLSEAQRRRWNGPAHEVQVLETCFAVAGATHLAQVAPLLAASLPSLGVHQYCFSVIPSLARFEQEPAMLDPHLQPQDAQFVPVAMFPRAQAPDDQATFLATLLAPEAWVRGVSPGTLLVLPIASRTTWYGIFTCEMAPGMESLALQLQGALVLVCEREEQMVRSMRQNLSEWSRSLVQAEKTRTTEALVRGVAHEINTPLGVCVTLASTVQSRLRELEARVAEGSLNRRYMLEHLEANHQGLDLLESNLTKMADLVRTFKKVSAAEYVDQSDPFDLVAETRALVDFFRVDLNARFIELDVQASGALLVQINRSVLQEVVNALVQNAMDHAFPAGTQAQPKVFVSLALADGTEGIRLCVADNGVGVAPELRQAVFEPFFTTKRLSNHVGLGLAIVRGLVMDGLAGTIECTPNPGGGAAFVVTFPGARVP